jgi:hypothetical protein
MAAARIIAHFKKAALRAGRYGMLDSASPEVEGGTARAIWYDVLSR